MDRLRSLTAFAEQDPSNLPLRLELLDGLLAAGKLADAQRVLEEAPAAVASTPEMAFRGARLAMLDGQLAKAAELLERLLVQVDDPAIRHDLAYCQLALGRVDDAEATLQPQVHALSDYPSIGFLHARILHYRARFEDATLVIRAVCDAHPELAEGWGILSMVRLDAADVEGSRSAAERALALDSTQADALTAIGTLALWSGQAADATAAFGQAVRAQPRSGRALAGAGLATMLAGDAASARATLEQAVRYMPGHIGTWHALAWCDLLEGRVDAASAAFDRALALDRNFGESHGGIALVHVLRGESGEGHASVRRALRLDPESRNARYAQSLLWQAEGREREAASLVEGIFAESGSNAPGRPVDFIQRLRARLTANG